MKCKHENLTPMMFNGHFIMVCKTCGKWVIDMVPKEINTTAIDWSDEDDI